MWQRGCFPTKTLIPPRRLHRIRDPYAASRTLLQRVRTRRRNCIGQLSPFSEYAPGTAHFPVLKSATIKLTHYPRGGSGSVWKFDHEIIRLVNADPRSAKKPRTLPGP